MAAILPPPYTNMDDSDSDDDNDKTYVSPLMIELKHISDSACLKNTNEIETFLNNHFPSEDDLKEIAQTKNEQILFSTFHFGNEDNYCIFNAEMKSMEQLVNIKTENRLYKIVNNSHEIDHNQKTISRQYIISYFESKCKNLGYSYEKNQTEIKIKW